MSETLDGCLVVLTAAGVVWWYEECKQISVSSSVLLLSINELHHLLFTSLAPHLTPPLLF